VDDDVEAVAGQLMSEGLADAICGACYKSPWLLLVGRRVEVAV
jgi:hypothetical protein